MRYETSDKSMDHQICEESLQEQKTELSYQGSIKASANGSSIEEARTNTHTAVWRPPAAMTKRSAVLCSKADCLYIVELLAKMRYGTLSDNFLTMEEFENLYKCIKAWFGARLKQNGNLIFDGDFELEFYSILFEYKSMLYKQKVTKVIFTFDEVDKIKFLVSYVRAMVLFVDSRPQGGSGGGVSQGRERDHDRDGFEHD